MRTSVGPIPRRMEGKRQKGSETGYQKAQLQEHCCTGVEGKPERLGGQACTQERKRITVSSFSYDNARMRQG